MAINSLQSEAGWGIDNFSKVFASKFYLQALQRSLEISFWSSVFGIVIATLGAYSLRQVDSKLRDFVSAFANMTSNFAGVPLAFAFIILLGFNGALTLLLKQVGLLEDFSIYSKSGLILVYTYFQIPLGVLLLYPAFDALREDWRESAALLGANHWQYWRHIGLPVLAPALLGTFVILLANALGAYATVYALTTGNFNVLPIRIAGLVAGDISLDPNLASALAMVLVGLMTLVTVVHQWLLKGATMRADIRSGGWYHRLVVYLLFLILLLPLAGTLLYSLATSWSASLLPSGLTLKWYAALWSEPRFLAAFGQSLLVCVGALLLSVVLILPLLFVVHYHFPRLDALMNILILLPFAVPPVVSSVGLLQLYGSGPMAMVGTPWILIGCYFTIALPFMYRAITNNLQAINLRDLMDAAQLLGASTWQAALLVVLPNLRQGLMVAVLLSFSFLFGEFVFANLLVGTRYETLQVYLNNMRNSSGHFNSALVISYFAFVLVLTWVANRLNKDKT